MTETKYKKMVASELQNDRRHYLKSLTAPRDGMWETFVEMGDHYGIYDGVDRIGYFVLNNEQRMLQFSIQKTKVASPIFQDILQSHNVQGVVVMTNEPLFLSLTLDHQKNTKVNALEYVGDIDFDLPIQPFPDGAKVDVITLADLERAIDFAHDALGASKEWLKGYYSERIDRKELFGLWVGGDFIATGERRFSRLQEAVADVGMVVSKQHRKKGIATKLLQFLHQLCREEGMTSICSTEASNIGAQKAIEAAGYISKHRILDVAF